MGKDKMSSDIPDKIDVVLEGVDTKTSIASIVNAMSLIRREAISDKEISEDQKDAYLHLTYRLASFMEVMAGENDNTARKIDEIKGFLRKDSDLVFYDSLQHRYWSDEKPNFAKTLDSLLISVMADNLNSVEHRHHFIQAVKYLRVQDASFEEKEKMFESILPYHGSLSFKKPSTQKRILAKLFGYSLDVQKKDSLTLRMKECSHEFIEDAIVKAQYRGYRNLETNLHKKVFDELAEKFPKSQISLPVNKKVSKLETIARKTLAYSLKATAPVSYTILGLLPEFFAKAVLEATGCPVVNCGYNRPSEMSFSKRAIANTSFWMTGLGFGALCAYNWTTGVDFFNVTLSLLPLYLSLESIFRGVAATDGFCDFSHHTPSLLTKIGLLPLEYLLRHVQDKRRQRRDELGPLLEVSIKLDGEKYDQNKMVNVFKHFQNLVSLEVPKGAEESLQWSTHKHHTFAMELDSYLNEHMEYQPEKLKIKKVRDRELKNYQLLNIQKLNEYNKVTSLVWTQENRYVLSYVHKGSLKEDEIKSLTRELICGQEGTVEKARQMVEKNRLWYLHLVEYRKNQLVNDYEVIR